MRALLLLLLLLLGWPPARAARSREAPRVVVAGQGALLGRELLLARGQRVAQFLAVPFAQPPTGALRFAPPRTRPLPAWDGDRDATAFAPACPQSREELERQELVFKLHLAEMLDEITFDEDCLYLNVYVPDGTSPPGGWPVMVWFHPGNFNTGAPQLWDGSVLAAKQKVIIVTAAYRLNIFGFLALGNGLSPGNYGLHDQVAALDWVKGKISAFGGSASDVCIFGHGAGGISVGLHTISPLSSGKFARAIAMSGNALVPAAVTRSKTQEVLESLAERFACRSASHSDLLPCLRNAPTSPLAARASLFQWGPVVDADANASTAFLPKEPKELLEDGQFKQVDFMAGYTNMEDALLHSDIEEMDKGLTQERFYSFLSDMVQQESSESNNNETCVINDQYIIESVSFFYRPYPQTSDTTLLRDRYMDLMTERNYGAGAYLQALKLSKVGSTYFYRFDYKPKHSLVPIKEWVKVPHRFDLPFVWGMPYWPNLASSIVWYGGDRKISDVVMNLWTNFAKNSNPIQNTLNIKWEAFTEEKPGVMILDRFFNMSDGTNIDYKAFEFWNNYYPVVVQAATQCCIFNNTATKFHENIIPNKIKLLLVGISYLVMR
ncbi:cocaine esterase [Schistocerca cancellata]|uniref:cocaine esterase n=1 Tax=Schistocerca cancellata TaxID=274614 RepID=UPI002119ACFF|nr:cocaine esterase [Schistocerca cancellata]